MEFLFEILFLVLEFFGEVLIEFVFELLLHVFSDALTTWGVKSSKPRGNTFFVILFSFFGFGAGLISLLVFRTLLIRSFAVQLLNLILSPILLGFFMAWIGKWRKQRDKEPLRIDTFANGCAFAFFFALVRWIFLK